MIWGTLFFAIAKRAELGAYWQKHGQNLSAALRDALPLIEEYRSRVAPTNDAVKQVEAAVRTAAQEDPRNRNDADFTYNPNAG
jgi:hypothetical protein